MPRTEIVIRAGHGITEKLLAGRQSKRHELEQLTMDIGREIPLGDKRTPGRIADITWHHLRQALLAHGRPNPVRALFELGKAMAAMILRDRKGIAQQAIDPFPCGKYLWAPVLVRQAPLCIENLAGCDLNAKPVGRESETAQPLDQFLLGDNAGTTPGKLGLDPFVNIHRPARVAQHKAAEQTAHRTANDDCAPRARPAQRSASIFSFTRLSYI